MRAIGSICDIVEQWLGNHAERLGWKSERLVRDWDRGTLAAGYDLPGILLSIGAWEDGVALDMDILERESGTGNMVCAGPCADPANVETRLASIAPWIAKHMQI